jgi:hypothetical protein
MSQPRRAGRVSGLAVAHLRLLAQPNPADAEQGALADPGDLAAGGRRPGGDQSPGCTSVASGLSAVAGTTSS